MNTFNTAEYFNIFNNEAAQHFTFGRPKKWLLPGADASEADEAAQDPTSMLMEACADELENRKNDPSDGLEEDMEKSSLADAGFGLKTAFEKYYNGDPLTDAEIDAIVWFTSQYADFGWVLPERFALFIAALKDVHSQCSKIQAIRAERKKDQNESHGHAPVPGEPAPPN